MIKAAIFDMDGLLIDSEPFWQEAMKLKFKLVNITLTTGMCIHTQGMRIDEVVRHWYKLQPWSGLSLKELEEQIVQQMEALITEKGVAMDGVAEILSYFKDKKFKIGLASSSNIRLITAVLNRLGIAAYFDSVNSAQFEEFGKPHPAIYLKAAQNLEVKPQECIAFEDSYFGLQSALAAQMKAVAVPYAEIADQRKFNIAHVKLKSLKEFNDAIFEELSNS